MGHPHHPLPSRGMAALTVVMVLFFIMALVAAYTNRNLIFEQRVAANSYRSERAQAAADAATEWAIMMLNSGRVDMACQPSNSPADLPWRKRYLITDDEGAYENITVSNLPIFSSCVSKDGALTCVCPTEATPDPSPHAVKDWPLNAGGTAFRVGLVQATVGGLKGTITVDVRGCGTPGTGAGSCGIGGTTLPQVDGLARVRQTLGLVRALPVPPSAALTTGRAANVGGMLRVSNPDNGTGLTVHTGTTLTAASQELQGPAGSSQDGLLQSDTKLSAAVPAVAADRFSATDMFFRGVFGMEAPTYRSQPAVVRINCNAGACSAADLQNAVARYPGLTLWFDGDLDVGTLPSGNVLGDASTPVAVIVTGTFNLLADIDFTGFIYAPQITWASTAANAVVRGALVAVENFTAAGNATVLYDAAALKTIQLNYGSFVRAPGGWNRGL